MFGSEKESKGQEWQLTVCTSRWRPEGHPHSGCETILAPKCQRTRPISSTPFCSFLLSFWMHDFRIVSIKLRWGGWLEDLSPFVGDLLELATEREDGDLTCEPFFLSPIWTGPASGTNPGRSELFYSGSRRMSLIRWFFGWRWKIFVENDEDEERLSEELRESRNGEMRERNGQKKKI